VVILDMKSGTYFSLRGAGLDAWKLIERNASVAMISEALGERYDASSSEIATALDSLTPLKTRIGAT
jgi:Coenzyme PQQ synthesis protein D (PqqD)